MKRNLRSWRALVVTGLLLLGCGAVSPAFAQVGSSFPETGSSRVPIGKPADILNLRPTVLDANERIFEKVAVLTNSAGHIELVTNSITELATGLHYWGGNQWLPSNPKIELVAGGGQAVHGQHKVSFSANLNTAGATDLQLPDGRHLRHHILGLSYQDAASGKFVLFAELRDSTGQILPSGNQVLYPDAFNGKLVADVMYTYTIGGFEQFVILRTQLPAPESFGLNPQTTKLQVLTEFVNPAVPAIKPTGDGLDETLDFNGMVFGRGVAFALGGESKTLPVQKRWTVQDGRTFLVEETQYALVARQLASLPAAPKGARSGGAPTESNPDGIEPILDRVSPYRLLPGPKLARRGGGKLELAGSFPAAQGFVLDYAALVTQADFTFQSDTTYYVSSAVTLTGTNIIEGGTVVKFTNSPGAQIDLSGATVVCKTDSYRPAVFTSKDDDTLGESIPASSGTPSGFYGGGLKVGAGSLSNLRFSYAATAVQSTASNGILNLIDLQWVRCSNAVDLSLAGGSTNNIRNALFYSISNLFVATNTFVLNGEHLTVDQCAAFVSAGNGGATLNFTNSLLVGVVTWNGCTYITNANVISTSDTGIFLTVGAAAHYLTTNSAFRNVGTTNINAAVLADIHKKTTYPPIVYLLGPASLSQDTWTESAGFGPQAQRDTDSPDLGYHYDPIDYAFSEIYVTNAVLTFTNGCVITSIATSNSPQGSIDMASGGQFLCNGTPTVPNRIVQYNTVQEQANTNWIGALYAFLVPAWQGTLSSPTHIDCRFTDFSIMARDFPHVRGSGWLANEAPVNMQDCQFHGGSFSPSGSTLNLTNCLLERVYTTTYSRDGNTHYLINNLFWNGTLTVVWFLFSSTNSYIENNMFDRTSIGGGSPKGVVGYNGYITNYGMITPNVGTDVILTNSDYLTGSLGRYYYPTNGGMLSLLINAGSTTADQLGLYHFTTTTNQVKETNTTVDIGYHYVAVNTNGLPFDRNSDGIPDYSADANGNGTQDAGEVAW